MQRFDAKRNQNFVSDALSEKVQATLAAVKHLPQEKISLESSLAELGLDSLDTITLLFELEKHFHVSISDDQVRSLRTVRDIVEGVRRLTTGATLDSAVLDSAKPAG
ncbi:MAG: acyl carrier protein [Acidipila sp.]|nr:acyl carrier protein [Acidipila sp.]